MTSDQILDQPCTPTIDYFAEDSETNPITIAALIEAQVSEHQRLNQINNVVIATSRPASPSTSHPAMAELHSIRVRDTAPATSKPASSSASHLMRAELQTTRARGTATPTELPVTATRVEDKAISTKVIDTATPVGVTDTAISKNSVLPKDLWSLPPGQGIDTRAGVKSLEKRIAN